MILFCGTPGCLQALRGGATFPYSGAAEDSDATAAADFSDEGSIDNLVRWWWQRKRFRSGKDSPCVPQPARRLRRNDVQDYVDRHQGILTKKGSSATAVEELQLLQQLLDAGLVNQNHNLHSNQTTTTDNAQDDNDSWFVDIGETIHVQPTVGAVVLFYDTHENGVTDGSAASDCPLPVENRAVLAERHESTATNQAMDSC